MARNKITVNYDLKEYAELGCEVHENKISCHSPVMSRHRDCPASMPSKLFNHSHALKMLAKSHKRR